VSAKIPTSRKEREKWGTRHAEIDFARTYGTAEEAAEKLAESARSSPRALKRGHNFNDVAARVNSCPSRKPLAREFFRNG